MKGNYSKNKRLYTGLKEAGDMIASSPFNPSNPSLFELIKRELEKLNGQGSISPMVYSRALVLSRSLITQLNNIYSRTGSDLQPVIMFLLRQARR